MKKVDRATLRGTPLDKECKRANTTTHEYGLEDNRVFCYGLYAPFSDSEIGDIDKKCLNCKAYVLNATPLEELKNYE